MRRYLSSSDDGLSGCLEMLVAPPLAGLLVVMVWAITCTVPMYFAWNATVPDLLPGLVRAGFVPGQISLLLAFGASVLLSLPLGIVAASRRFFK